MDFMLRHEIHLPLILLHTMKRIGVLLLMIAAMLPFIGCTNSHAWEDMPLQISQFVNKYFPQEGITNYVENDGTYTVGLKNGATARFDDQFHWTSVNGNGGTLPEMLLFDQLPPELYEYLQELSQVDGVYAITRTALMYSAKLLDSTVNFTISTHNLRQIYD